VEFVRLPSGREVAIRPICRHDGERLEAAYAELSPASRYRRFLAAKPRLTADELRYLTDVDGRDHVALIAMPAADRERIIAVGRFIRLKDDPTAAEFAIVVGDPYQGEGLGTELIGRLADAAIDRGVARFTATVLADNEAIHRLMRHLTGEFVHRRSGPVEEVVVELAARVTGISSPRGVETDHSRRRQSGALAV
jgi:RimJ/RimL family protein N-acetyltransferase